MSGIIHGVLEKQSYMLIGRHDINNLMRRHPASACLPTSLAQPNADGHVADAEADANDLEISQLLMKLRPMKQESLICDNNKLILLASLSDSLEYIAESIERFGNASGKASEQVENEVKATPFHHKRSSSLPPKDLPSFAEDYRKLTIDCLKVLCVEIQLETVFDMQALSAIPSIDSQSVQTKLDHVRTYYELLNMPVEALLAFITEHDRLFTAIEYYNLLKVQVPGWEVPDDAKARMADILPI